MSITQKEIQNLRSRFWDKLEQSESDCFHPADIERVKTNDDYLKRFILHNDGNEDSAFNMLWDTCEWRKKFGVNDITEKNVNQNILELGSVFAHGKDKDGKTLLIFKSKKHFKGAYDFEDHKKCLVYWMERLERQENGDMISLFFDMDGAVMANMDMDYTKYLISLFKNYYPHFLNYIIIFEMAWILNAVFKVIKTWLPPKAVMKMKFVYKSNLKDLIDPEFALKSWGGKDPYVYQFEPESKIATSSSNSGDDNKKKVHFADGSFKQDQLNESGFEDSLSPVSASSSSGLTISPPDFMVFTQEGNEVTSSIVLKNNDLKSISYKIKTTSPEKFGVRPSAGVLGSGATATINVVLLRGYLVQSLQREKFLIMSIPVDHSDISQQEINDLWKQINDKNIQQHRLRCTIPQVNHCECNLKNGSAFNSQSTDDQKIISKLCSDLTQLKLYISNVQQEMKSIKQQQWLILLGIFLLLCSFIYVMYHDYLYPYSLRQECWASNRKPA